MTTVGKIAFSPDNQPRRMTGILSSLTAEQRERAFSYNGPINHGERAAYVDPGPFAYLRGARDLAFIAANDNVPAASRYSWLKGLPGYSYLGTVYSKYEAGRERAAIIAARAAARIMATGVVVYSPIAHSHTVAEVGGIDPLDWPLWKHQNEPLVERASSLIVLTMKGWEDSVGLTHEIATFVSDGRPIVYLTPAELGVVE